jgi:hypothetical protein
VPLTTGPQGHDGSARSGGANDDRGQARLSPEDLAAGCVRAAPGLGALVFGWPGIGVPVDADPDLLRSHLARIIRADRVEAAADLGARIDAAVRVELAGERWGVVIGLGDVEARDHRWPSESAAEGRADWIRRALRAALLPGPATRPLPPEREPDAAAGSTPIDVLIDDAVIAVDRLYERTTGGGPAWERAARYGAKAVAALVVFTHAVGAARRAERER